MARTALIVSYDGAAFEGWQTQASRQSVQDVLEAALGAIAGAPVRTVCAGRTDAGVHAIAQVVHFDTDAERPVSAWLRGTNALLPTRVAVMAAYPVDPSFHARFAARARHYLYLLHTSPTRHPLLAGRAGWTWKSLDIDAMRAAASGLLGEHDFSAFRSSQCQASTPVRRILRLQIDRNGDIVRLRCSGNAFLHHMVRNIVGALVAVGSGSRDPAWVDELLASRNRALGPATFSADGLYLVGVDYDPVFGLPPVSDSLEPWPAFVSPHALSSAGDDRALSQT